MAVLDGISLPPRWRITSRLFAGWPIDHQHLLELWPHGRTSDGRIRWFYRLSRYRRTVFSATDISSSVGATVCPETLINAAQTVLAFLTLGPNDTDAEFFANYTPAQLEWRDQYAEELSIYAMDGLCGYCGSDHASSGCTRES
ncbi:hypothetical protein [Nonomuraea sp. NEAU-A123]|uniref:hypothetical protein n=1 Tax=Nonomuraea sp. NEAU-A123 TaxID=2839649 RepID=UPI001BE45424|nr:hypothetical protein [Nonomuraea sp. NEAU-A123]MBT2233220.1 hypothetical protein [Nonomuraea sp. NEAU-A123]